MSTYNREPECNACDRANQDEWVTEAVRRRAEQPLPPSSQPLTCRQPSCVAAVCEKSARTNAPRWRELCADHYQEQRERQSIAALLAAPHRVRKPREQAAA